MKLFMILFNLLTLTVGAIGFTLGIISGSLFSVAAGGLAVLLSIYNIISITRED